MSAVGASRNPIQEGFQVSSSGNGKSDVVEMITQRIKNHGLSKSEIASSAGIDQRVLEMLIEGKTKLPINKVRPLAEALGVEPATFLRVVMQEYMPETYAAVCDVISAEFLSDFERDALDAVRQVSGQGQEGVCITRSEPLHIVSVPAWEKRAENKPSDRGQEVQS
jgi:transcriptional regulator with XRE-family HTH domain